MEERKPTTGKIALKYGLIFGVIGIIFTLMLYSQELHYQIDLKRFFINIALGLLFVVVGSILGMNEFKKGNNSYMSFGQGLKIGVGLSLISGIIAIIFSFVMTEVIDPDMQEKAINYATEMMQDAGMTEDQIDKQLAGQKEPNIPLNIGIGLIFAIFIGFIGALIPAIVIKKQEEVY